jgi:hypothetical protein
MKYYPTDTKLYVAHSDVFESHPVVSRLIKSGSLLRTNKPVSHHFREYDVELDGLVDEEKVLEDIVWTQQDYERRDALAKEVR